MHDLENLENPNHNFLIEISKCFRNYYIIINFGYIN